MARIFVVVLFALVAADPAYAYMGPGSGLAFLGSLVALIGAVLAAILGFIWYPVKRLFGFGSSRDEDDED